MNWLTNFVKPKIQALIQKNEVPENLWTKCTSCEHMLFHRDLVENLNVCHHCQHHMRLGAHDRLNILFDNGQFTHVEVPKAFQDPIKFKDTKKYADRLKDYRQKTGRDDSVVVAYGHVGNVSTVVSVFDFSFMGGSMGLAAGQAFLTGAELAVKTKSPYITVTASGGARMQEGILSLMQMPRTVIAVEKVREAGLPYITILTDPTTGGVSASFAMLGDIAIAEPGAIIGFTGARVIEETIRQKLPHGFQKSEYLLDHGMVDMVVSRQKMKETLGEILGILTQPLGHQRPHA
jgi:acetyl-CoA carboxylase carboxyl transferase subunit beta